MYFTQPIDGFKNDREFSNYLSDVLEGQILYSVECMGGKGRKIQGKTRISTQHQKIRKSDGLKPDITVFQKDGQILLEWRKLTQPFYIECKPNKLKIKKELYRAYKYKYAEINSPNDLKKYGDRHVVMTCPEFLDSNFDSRDFEKPNSNANLIRTLWHLGIGALYRFGDSYCIKFNEQEVAYIE